MKRNWIYIIKNTINDKVYIGQTSVSVESRWYHHVHAARKESKYLITRAIRKHGSENFTIETLEECNPEDVDKREVYYIKLFNSIENGYNVSIGGKTYTPPRPDIDSNVLFDLYNTGNYRVSDLARMFNVTGYIMKSELNKIGIKPLGRAQPYRISKSDIEKLKQLIKDGWSIRNSAKILNHDYCTVRAACIRNNIEYNTSKSVEHPFYNQDVVKIYAEL